MDQQKKIRPLSPHLQVYKLPLNAVASIVHRITGVILSVGLLLFVGSLLAISVGEDVYITMQNLMNHALGIVILWLFIYALFFHLCHGVRHLIWDAGNGFEREHMDRNVYIELIASVILTVAGFFLL
ncbi:succinate dehydrogenase, cytochrome b556 subunit [Methylobacter sp. YRD-M1]|uniref:succinate dehydrogenase, cytochrome b556 subunit n=1 Tax=Methylobacter sp. YRD-M1 TaxID=2911520 RepID=UPI00227B6031|nr:succinate dehydrogenase, cytochrome b556 subunit [Methylobacter sp. YRD-M1]WAK00417.1 succinate dehydrogenase, cytochrome b556 subunit [Methylobacter sp. YRD-M1]